MLKGRAYCVGSLAVIAVMSACTDPLNIKVGVPHPDSSVVEDGSSDSLGLDAPIDNAPRNQLDGATELSVDVAEDRAAEGHSDVSRDVTSCQECTLWELGGCGDGLTCQAAIDGADSACIQCTVPGKQGAGATCDYNSDCVPGYGCSEGVCRKWCAIDGAPGTAGACATGEHCIGYKALDMVGAGLCLPCGECTTAPQSCTDNRSCSTMGNCAFCHRTGASRAGEACSGHSDCASGLSCVSRVCRTNCAPGATSVEAGACAQVADSAIVYTCHASEQASNDGQCLPCGECDLFTSSCPSGMKCIAESAGCNMCVSIGPATAGSHCTDHSQCQAGLFCVDDVCREYCRPSAPAGTTGACGSGSCIGLNSQPGLGMCLPCGECTATSASQCRSDFACGSYGTCQVCVALGPQAAGTACDSNNRCHSLVCLDDVCRDSCSSTSPCSSGRCRQVKISDGTTESLCFPCNECDLLTQEGCQSGFKCIADSKDCTVCYPSGKSSEGSACESPSDCAGLDNCTNGVCLPYCDLNNTISCRLPKKCFGSSASLPSNVGNCLPCGQCMPWSADSCGASDLTCNQYSGCAICEGVGGPRTEGQSCVLNGDCVRNLHCYIGLCRAYCKQGAAQGTVGGCNTGRTCQPVDANLQSLGGGICLP